MATVAPIHGGDVMAAAARWQLDPEMILDYSANINPFGPPAGVLEAARAALAGVSHYPEPFARTLRAALAQRHHVAPEAVLVGNGAAEVIHLLLRQAAGRRVAVPAPGFAEYGRAARAVGATVLPVPVAVEGGCLAIPPLSAGDSLILCNPHNPTGRLWTPAQVLELAAATPATLVVDEAFMDLTLPGEAGSVIPHVAEVPNLVVVRSLTKFYAMPGLRVGYAIASPKRVAALDAVRDPWSVSTAAQQAAQAALADQEYARRTRAWVTTEPAFLAAELAKLPGFLVAPPAANFILVRAPEPAWVLQERLGPRGVLIRDCRSFTGLTEYHMRLAVRARPQNLRLLAELRAAVGIAP